MTIMKTTFKYTLSALIILFILTGCRNYSEPKIDFEVLNWTANKTIAELKAMHPITNPSAAPTAITDDVIIKRIVTDYHLSGNIYKSIYIQDETGGINTFIHIVNHYIYYTEGQTV